MEWMILRIILLTIMLLMAASAAVALIFHGKRKKKLWYRIVGIIALPLSLVVIFIMVTYEIEEFTGQKAEWQTIFHPSQKITSIEEKIDTNILKSWPFLSCPINRDTSLISYVNCYYTPEFDSLKLIIKNISGRMFAESSEISFRTDISLGQSFEGELILEARSRDGKLISRNSVHMMQHSTAIMSIEFRLKEFDKDTGNFLLLHFKQYSE
jgi:hypothetical protein